MLSFLFPDELCLLYAGAYIAGLFDRVGVSTSNTGLVFALAGVVSICSLVGLVLSFLVFSLVHNEVVFFVSALAIGLGFGISVPAFQCLFVNVASLSMRGTATSTFLTSLDLGVGVGMLTAGYIASYTNLSTVYLCGSGCCLLSLLVYI